MGLSNRSLHILIIPSWYPHFDGDIRGSFFREQAIALRNKGHKVGVIYPQFRSIKKLSNIFTKSYGLSNESDNGINVIKWHTANFTPRIKNIMRNRWLNLGMKLYINYVKKFGEPDLIHVHSLNYAGLLALEIKNKYSIPYVVTEHSSAFATGTVSKNDIKRLKPVIKSSLCNFSVSNDFASLLNRVFNVSSWVYMPNIVDQSFLESPLSIRPKEFTFITICILKANKSIDMLIRAFAKVNIKYPKTKLSIGGNGPEKRRLQKLVKDLDLENKVEFLGELSRTEVNDALCKSSVFVLPSKYETFGVVLIEALASGLPVIATKCGGPESIINKNVGLLTDNQSETKLADAMIYIIKNYHEYKQNSIRDYCIANFSQKAIIDKLEDIYIQSISSIENE